MENPKKSTHKIMVQEVVPINNERLFILKDIEDFYQKNRGSSPFPIKRQYFETTIEFKNTVLDKIIAKDSNQILKAIRDAFSLITIMMEERFSSINQPLIDEHNDQELLGKISDIIKDEDDAQHIIDISFWASMNGTTEFISLNSEHISKHEVKIKTCLILHNNWKICNVSFTHPTDYL